MRFEYADGRMPVAMTRGGATYYLSYDQVGSLRAVVDSSGAVVRRVDHDSFGNIVNDTNPTFGVPFGFAGGLHDRNTGLVRFGFRDYDPDTGRWTAKDPILFKGRDTNVYGYVLNDPLNGIDPDGLWRMPDYLSANINVAIPNPWTGTLIGWSGTASLDRYGNWYWSPLGGGVGKSATFVSGSVTANWMNQPCEPSEWQLNNFLSGSGFNATAGFWGGVSESWSPGNGSATGVGFVTPQAGVSYNYSFQGAGNTELRW
jgi:RHS repeat-associated protein